MIDSHPTTDGYVLRAATADEVDAVMEMVLDEFGEGYDPELNHPGRDRFEPERNHVITDDDTIVANAGAYTADLSVPGARVPAAHVTDVAVRSTHRRKGLLTRLMTHQLGEIRAAGREPIAVLWASEGRIYQRFGYGLATKNVQLTIDSREVSLPADTGTGRLRAHRPEAVGEQLRQVYLRVAPERPGWTIRNERWWACRLFDHKEFREGAGPLRATLYERAPAGGGVDGYALWRMKAGDSPGGPAGTVIVVEVVAATAEAYTALWRYLLTMDLTRTVRTSFGPVDEPLLHLVDEPRRLGARIGDGLWLRLVDVPAALSRRRYAAAVDLVFEVSDALLPANAGRYRLRAGTDGVAGCDRCDEPPDLACDVADLAAVYLGGTPLGRLADAGRVRELRPDAVRTASAAFDWHRDPSGLEMF